MDDFRDLPCVYDAATIEELPRFGQVSVQYVERFLKEADISSGYERLTLIKLTRYGERTASFSLRILTNKNETDLIVYGEEFSVISKKKVTGFNIDHFADEMSRNTSPDSIYNTHIVVMDVTDKRVDCFYYKDVNPTYFNRIVSLEAFN